MTEASVIVGFARSPFTPANKGLLATVRPDDLVAGVIAALVARTGIRKEDVADVIVGNAFPEGEQGFNIGRMAALLAGLPVSVPGQVVNRWCGSSMEAIHIAAGNIATGKGELFIAAGVESMTRIPMGGYNPLPNPQLYKAVPDVYMSMGLTAEKVAKHCAIARGEQDAFAIDSHAKAAKADFSEEIVPVATRAGTVQVDGCIRATSTLEDLAKLTPVFDAAGSVTAGTSSPLTDGAAAVVVASASYARAHGLPVLAQIRSMAVVGLEPGVMGLGPVAASRQAMERAGITAGQLDVVELNEAFAAQALACVAELGLSRDAVNSEGGAIALGHPLGASGARITGKAAQLLHRNNGRYALATACIGGGMGIATVLERV